VRLRIERFLWLALLLGLPESLMAYQSCVAGHVCCAASSRLDFVLRERLEYVLPLPPFATGIELVFSRSLLPKIRKHNMSRQSE
jgi:hypothetical protein